MKPIDGLWWMDGSNLVYSTICGAIMELQSGGREAMAVAQEAARMLVWTVDVDMDPWLQGGWLGTSCVHKMQKGYGWWNVYDGLSDLTKATNAPQMTLTHDTRCEGCVRKWSRNMVLIIEGQFLDVTTATICKACV
jgi:hypothetical protein